MTGQVGVHRFETDSSCVLLDFYPLRDRVCLGFSLPRRHYVTQTRSTFSHVHFGWSDGSENGSSGAQRWIDVNSVHRRGATATVSLEDWWSTTAAISLENRWSTTTTVTLEVT